MIGQKRDDAHARAFDIANCLQCGTRRLLPGNQLIKCSAGGGGDLALARLRHDSAVSSTTNDERRTTTSPTSHLHRLHGLGRAVDEQLCYSAAFVVSCGQDGHGAESMG